MWTALTTELKIRVRDLQTLVLLFVLPAMLVLLLSKALAPLYPGNNPYERTLPGFTLLFAFFGMTYAADGLFRERAAGNWPRLLSLPIPRWKLVLGKALAPALIIVVQITLLFVVGAVAYDVRLGDALPFAALTVSTAVAATSVGVLLAGRARSHVEVEQLANILVLTSASLGGCLVPVARLPGVLRNVAPATPHYWALDGFTNAMASNGRVLVPIFALAGFSILMLALGALTFRFDRMLQPV